MGGPKLTEAQHAATRVKTRKPLTGEKRWYALGQWAEDDAEVGNLAAATSEANELLALIPKHKDDWNYGNAIQDANIALGEVALKKGDVASAKKYLLAAGQSPGSPQMSTFGPDPRLACHLLEKGEKQTVLDYLSECSRFWQDRELGRWTQDVEQGNIPRGWNRYQ